MLPFSMEISGRRNRMKQYFPAFLAFLASWCCLCCPLLCHLSPWLSEAGGYRGILRSWRRLTNNKAQSRAFTDSVMPAGALQEGWGIWHPQSFSGGEEVPLLGWSPASVIVVTSPIRVMALAPSLSLLRVRGSFGIVPFLALQPLWFRLLTPRGRQSPDVSVQILHAAHGKDKMPQQSNSECPQFCGKSPGVAS